MKRVAYLFFFCISIEAICPPVQATVQRNITTEGKIIEVKGDEQIRLVNTQYWEWLTAEIEQDLAGGDHLRTGPYGGLAILFRDQTQIRVHRNSRLLIKENLRLERGAIWVRDHPAGSGFRMETPAVNLSVRGTDWAITVGQQGVTTLVVLAGEIEFFNEFGSLTVTRGEIATAEIGKAPTKTFLVNPRDRPQWQLEVGIEWMDLFNILEKTEPNAKSGQTNFKWHDQANPSEDLIELAALSFDQHQYNSAKAYLARAVARTFSNNTEQVARIRVLQGFLGLRERTPAEADQLFAEAIPILTGRWRRTAELGRFQAQVEQGFYKRAEVLITELLQRYDTSIEVHLAAIWLQSFQGEQERAIQQAIMAQHRFPDDARFSTLLGHLYLLADRPEATLAAIDAALAKDEGQLFAWELKGLYEQQVVADPQQAIRAYRRALELGPATASVWAKLGTVYTELGEYRQAESSFAQAIRLDPGSASYKARYALLLLYLNRTDEAEPLLQQAIAIGPTNSEALRGMGFLALSRGHGGQAVDWILRATTVDPGLAAANAQLGIAYYQGGHRRAAEQAFDNARRLDPRDPIPDLFQSVVAQEQAEAGQAIRHARRAYRKYTEWKNYSVETIASDRNGTINLGSAYANLGLTAWGDYYAQLSFDPYWANSHFGVGALYESARAKRGSDVQGLLLDPLAYSRRNRYTDFVKQPFADTRLGGMAGSHDGASLDRQHGTVQGYTDSPKPLSYALVARRETDNNSFSSGFTSETEIGELSAGVKLDEANTLGLGIGAARYRQPAFMDLGEEQPDLNESGRRGSEIAGIGYQYRFGPKNRLLIRAAASHLNYRTHNPDPFGINLGDLDFSLISSFGRDNNRKLHDLGLYDASSVLKSPDSGPVLAVGPLGAFLGLKPISNTIVDPLSLNSRHDTHHEQWYQQLQFRHLLDLKPFEVTYGAEWHKYHNQLDVKMTSFRPLAKGSITFDGVNFLPFDFGTATKVLLSDNFDQNAALAYVGSRWKITPNFWSEGALYLHYFDDGIHKSIAKLDPRFGLGWRLASNQWLRAVMQRDLFFQSEGTLAPVAALGVAIPDTSFALAGDSITDARLRLDSEWNRHIFTFAQIGQQTIQANIAPPLGDKRRVRDAMIGANLWLIEGFGFGISYRRFWAENLSHGPFEGNNLPLVPNYRFDLGLNYVHPWQIRTALTQSYVGARSADLANTSTLDGYWTTDVGIRWEPDDKHWLMMLNIFNLFDSQYQTWNGVSAPKRTVVFSFERRF